MGRICCWQTGHCRVGIIISCFAAAVLHPLCDQSDDKRDSVYSEVVPCTPHLTPVHEDPSPSGAEVKNVDI